MAANCSTPMAATSNGVWQHNDPIDFAFPLFIIQIILVLVVTRTLAFLFKPLRQPRVIGEIIGGILLGPTLLGRNQVYRSKIFPERGMPVLDTAANMGLLFFLFMVGLELDLKALRRVGSQAMSIAAAGMVLPFAAGAGVSVVIHNTIATGSNFAPFLVFMGVAMSITAFPVLARILAERKLLTTDVGQMAMAAAAVNDVSAWILLALAVALSGSSHSSGTVAIWVLLCGLAFVIFMFVVVKPFMTWMARQSLQNEAVKETYVCVTLALVLVAGFTTDAIGIHCIFGAFVLGLIIPKDGSFAPSLIEKMEDFVSVLLLPLYFASSGLKTDIASIHSAHSWGLLVLVIVVACVGKILGTVIVSQFYTNNLRKSVTLGFLMNTKGLVELIVLNIGKDRGVLNDEVFAIMVLMALFTTCITTPIVMALYKPARNITPYTRRRLSYRAGWLNSEPDLRILSCVHGIRNVPAMINLVETVRGQTKQSIRLYVLHLMELTERSSAIMLVHRARRDGRPFCLPVDESTGAGRTDQVVIGFEAFQRLSKVTVRPMMTAISYYEDMHEDICVTAEDKQASIIVLPFHKQQLRLDGGFENVGKSDLQTVNKKVLQYAPCSVGILIDRGLWGDTQIAPSNVDHNAVVLFFGGPDDREALAFGIRMAQHPGVKLTVVRYIAGDVSDSDQEETTVTSATSAFSVPSQTTRSGPAGSVLASRLSHGPSSFMTLEMDLSSGSERQQDEELLATVIHESKTKHVTYASITYEEVEVGIADLTACVMEAGMEAGKVTQYDLILVGRGCRRPSPLLAALLLGHRRHAANDSYSELGPVGELLTSSSIRSSVLVVQQYEANPSVHDSNSRPDSLPSPRHLSSPSVIQPSDSPV